MSGLLNRLKTVLKGEAKSESPVVMDAVSIPIQKEQRFFAKKNNLMDFEKEAPAIESSNLSAWERYIFPIETEYKGFYLQAEDQNQLEIYMKRVDNNETQGLWTIAEFTKKYLPVLNEEAEKYENDIENMPAYYKQLPKPDYGKSTTAKISLRPAKVYSEESSNPIEDMGIMLSNVQEIHLTDLHKSYIERPIGDTRTFSTFKNDWEAEKNNTKQTEKLNNFLSHSEDADIIN